MKRKIIYCVFFRATPETAWASEAPTDDPSEVAQQIEQARALGCEVCFKRLEVHHSELQPEPAESLSKLLQVLKGR